MYYVKKIKIILIFFFSLFLPCFANTEEKLPDLYSQEYFDYLIESTRPTVTIKSKKEKDQKEEQKAENTKKREEKQEEEINIFEFNENETAQEITPFKLKIEETNIAKYSQTYIVEDTKTLIPLGEHFSFSQDFRKFKNNKYNSDEMRTLTGAEYRFNKYFKVSSGLEANYRGMDQIPVSKKIYFTPSINIGEKFSIDFHNKYYTQTKETDHDIGLNFSPLKSKALDLGVYAGLTHEADGSYSESIIFKTSFSFF